MRIIDEYPFSELNGILLQIMNLLSSWNHLRIYTGI